MKLSDHVDKLRNLIEVLFGREFARLGIGETNNLNWKNWSPSCM